jgi:hypothetical protein
VFGGSFAPDMPGHLSNFSTTADGWAWKSHAVFADREDRQVSDRESRALMVEICENGQLRLFCGRAAEQLGTSGYGAGFYLFDDICLGLTARMVSLAAGVSPGAGYLWELGLRGWCDRDQGSEILLAVRTQRICGSVLHR